MLRRLLRVCILLFFCGLHVSGNAQNVKWLQGVWRGKSYFPGSDATQYFALTLRVTSIKGTKFEGYLSTMERADTAIRYDAKIVGEIFPGYIVIDPTKVIYVRNAPGSRWQLSCINCTPAKFEYAISDKKFSMKGGITECYKECMGTSEFVREIDDMNAEDQDSVYALLHMEKPKDETAIAKNDETKIVTVAAAEEEENKAAIARQKHIEDSIATAKALREKEENEMPARIKLTTKGNIVKMKDENKDILASQNLIGSLRRKRPTLPVYTKVTFTQEPPPADTIKAATAVNNKPVVSAPVIVKDTVPKLPAGYKEREVTVMRVINVNADSVTIRVYDNGVVDGDIVSVVYNDKTVIEKLSLTSKAYTVKIPVNKNGVNTLVFHAHNLGEFPPNTAQLEIIWGNKKEEMTVSSDLTVSSSVNIVYKP